MRPSPGLVLDGRYTLTERIALGGMATVWRATDETLGRTVAVKFLHDAILDSPDFVARFRSEARHAAGLSHPGIATVFDYVESSQGAYLIMEFVDGEPLSALLTRTPRPPVVTTTAILAAIAEALAVAHASGVIHRDIKPSNVMITRAGQVKVTDFGIARALDAVSMTAAGRVIGTPQYMSPEQVTGQALSPATDVYSLGVVGYEMLAGARPFTADTALALGLAHVHESPPPLSASVPAGLRALIEECLDKDPSRRPSSATEFARRARAVDGSSDAHATPTVALESSEAAATRVATRSAAPAETIAVRSPAAAVTATPLRSHATEIMPAGVIAGPSLAHVLRADTRRRRRRIGAATAIGTLVVAGLVMLSRSEPDRPTGVPAGAATAPDTTAAAAETTAPPDQVTAATPPTAAETTASSVATATIDEGAYLGRSSDEVVAELTVLGFAVTTRTIKSDAGRNTVLAVEPSGQLAVGTSVVVRVADKKGRKD